MHTQALTHTETDASIRDYVTLMKPGVMSLVVFTGAVGLFLAPGSIHPFIGLVAVLAIALGSGAGAVINMWFDRDMDAVMKRTQKRPIPAGRIAAEDALAMGLMLSFLSVGLLGIATNWVAAFWLGFAILFYGVIYTMLLKRTTPHNIVIGGAAGALPPVIGWAAVTGTTPLFPWLLFLVIFLWTPPHFWALALYRHDDYKNAHVPMLPVVAGPRATKRQILLYSLLLAASAIAPALFGFAGILYLAAAGLLSLRFVMGALTVLRSDNPRDAMRLFGFSILYLFALFTALVADRVLAIIWPHMPISFSLL